VSDNKTYTIEEAAELTGVSRHTLRYYERIGLLAPVGRASSGHRRYDDGDLGSILFLTLLRQTGMPIRDMQRFVELTRTGDHTIPQRVEVLETHRDALCERLTMLNDHLKAIQNKIGFYRDLLGEAQPIAGDGTRVAAMASTPAMSTSTPKA
jgi:DNA-binding transcriptional MerR regulator